MRGRVALAVVGSLCFLRGAVACCRGTKPDPTFIDTSEFYVNSISPIWGTRFGGTRVSISGGGFNTNFFTGG